MRLTADVKAQKVAQLEPQVFRNALLHAHAIGLFVLPAASHQGVVLGQNGAVREVDFTVQKALAPIGFHVVCAQNAAIDGHQAASNHREPIGRLHTGLVQVRQKGLGLVGLHVDHKTVWRVHRRGLAPTGDQVGAQQHQQSQRQQTHRQSAHLHHRKHRSGRHLTRGQTQPTRRRLVGHHPAQQPQRGRGHGRKHQQRHSKAAHRDQAQGEVTADHDQGHGKTQQTHQQHQTRAHLHAAQIAANHAQRRHLRQLQDWRQAKSHQQGQAHGHAHQSRLQGGSGQIGLHQTRQQMHKAQVHAITGQHAKHTGHHTRTQKFQAITQCECALALPQNPQQSTGVKLPLGKASGRQGHGHGAQQGGQQSHQVQKL